MELPLLRVASLDVNHSSEGMTKVLIRLHGYRGCSAPFCSQTTMSGFLTSMPISDLILKSMLGIEEFPDDVI